MGTDRVSVQNLKVVKVDEAGITLKGVVPGHKHGLIEVITM
jgi:ribosomal protein L3